MTAQDRLKTEDAERVRERAFREGFRAAREKYGVTEEPMPEAALEYARRVYSLEGVERVYARVYADDVMDLWTSVSLNDDSLRCRIRDIEGRIWDAFPFHVFDFGVLVPSTIYTKNSLERSGFNLIPRETPVAVRCGTISSVA